MKLSVLERKADILTDRIADAGVKGWLWFLNLLGGLCDQVVYDVRNVSHKLNTWLMKITDGEYDESYEDDIIVKLWEQKYGGKTND